MNFEEKWTVFTESETRLYTTSDKRLAAQFWEFGKAEMKASAERIAAEARAETARARDEASRLPDTTGS